MKNGSKPLGEEGPLWHPVKNKTQHPALSPKDKRVTSLDIAVHLILDGPASQVMLLRKRPRSPLQSPARVDVSFSHTAMDIYSQM